MPDEEGFVRKTYKRNLLITIASMFKLPQHSGGNLMIFDYTTGNACLNADNLLTSAQAEVANISLMKTKVKEFQTYCELKLFETLVK